MSGPDDQPPKDEPRAASQPAPTASNPSQKALSPSSIEAQAPQTEQALLPTTYTAFSPGRKAYILGLVTLAGFLGPLAGNIYLPALPVLKRVFGVGATAINATVSAFMVVFAVAPLFWASLADWKGRRPLYIISILFYIASNILLAALPANFGALTFLRVAQAFGSSAVVSMGAGTVADVTPPKQRARAMSLFLLGPQCGPVLGPVLGGALAGESSWRWIFGFLAISAAVVWLLIVLSLPETLRCRVGNGDVYARRGFVIWPAWPSSDLAPESQRGPPPPKPTLIGYWGLFRYPPIGICSFNSAILYSSYFCIAVELPRALGDVYYWSPAAVGGGYLAVGVAMIVGSMVGGHFSDWRRTRAVKALGRDVDPEHRLIDQIWGVLLCAGGCLMFGWCVEESVHAAAVIVATFLTGFGMSWVFVSTTSFLTECVPQQAAGAFALGNLLRNPGAAIAAVVIQPLVSRMGWSWCFTGLCILDLVVVGTAVLVLRWYGPEWRKQRAAKMAPK